MVRNTHIQNFADLDNIIFYKTRFLFHYKKISLIEWRLDYIEGNFQSQTIPSNTNSQFNIDFQETLPQ